MAPDIFTNAHKGIRKALFDACIALGRENNTPASAPARALLRNALRFVAHHGENEDLLLLPLLERTAPAVYAKMSSDHAAIDRALHALENKLDHASANALYQETAAFTAIYLQHLHQEEVELEPMIRQVLSTDALATFSRTSVERTAPEEARMMLGFMLPVMIREDAHAMLAKMPAAFADTLRPLLED